MGQCCSQEARSPPFQDLEVETKQSDKTNASSNNQLKESPLIRHQSKSKKNMYATKFEEEEEDLHTNTPKETPKEAGQLISPSGRSPGRASTRNFSVSPAAAKVVIIHLPAPEVATQVQEGPKMDRLNAITVMEKLGPFRYDGDNDDVQPFSEPYQFVGTLEVYQGHWQNGKRNGRGEQSWFDGAAYQGSWKDDLRSGKGRYVDADGNIFEGIWKDDGLFGQGKALFANGVYYSGTWHDGEKHGHGYEVGKDTKYDGDFQHGMKQGRGTQIMPDGAKYIGEFNQNAISGKGTMEWPDGRKYVGTWKDNKMHGKGEFFWPDGRKYTGDYVEDMKDGIGEFMWADRRKYKGGFKQNKMHGKGVMISAAGQSKEGVWDYGVQLNS